MKHHRDKTEANIGDFRELDNRQAMLGKYRRHCVADASKVSVLGFEVRVDLIQRGVLEFSLSLGQSRCQLIQISIVYTIGRRRNSFLRI